MKKFLILLSIFLLTGCNVIKRDNMEGITIYTTTYPIEYVTNYLYGKNSDVLSIYPDGVDPYKYKLTDKQIKDYSKTRLFVFNGLSDEKDYVTKFFKKNKEIKIIDATSSMEYDSKIEELWLNPANLLMLAQNVKTGLNEYINNGYLKAEINNNYDELKIEISNLDAKIKLTAENADDNTIVVASDMFNFLKEKYKFNVISLEENDALTEKTKAQVVSLIKDKKISYIFVPKNEEINETVKNIVNETQVKVEYLHTLANLSDLDRKNKQDYISIMYENIELIKKEIYK